MGTRLQIRYRISNEHTLGRDIRWKTSELLQLSPECTLKVLENLSPQDEASELCFVYLTVWPKPARICNHPRLKSVDVLQWKHPGLLQACSSCCIPFDRRRPGYDASSSKETKEVVVLFLEGEPPVTRTEHSLCRQIQASPPKPALMVAQARLSGTVLTLLHGQLLSNLLTIVTPNNFWKWVAEYSNGI